MNVIVFASRKGGSGKSTLAAHLAAQIDSPTVFPKRARQWLQRPARDA